MSEDEARTIASETLSGLLDEARAESDALRAAMEAMHRANTTAGYRGRGVSMVIEPARRGGSVISVASCDGDRDHEVRMIEAAIKVITEANRE